MAAVEFLRGFISERLTAAAAEILGVFEQTIVQYEEELDRQRKLLDIILKPEIKLHRIDLPQQHSCQVEDVLADQQLCNQRKKFTLDQEEPEPPQVKEEQQEVCHEGEQHVLKEETDPSLVTAAYDGPEPNHDMVLSHNAPQVLPQQHDCKEEEILSDQQLCNQEKNSSLEHFDLTVIQYKEEINHQSSLLNIILTPEIRLYRTALSPQHNFKEEELILANQQLCNQERNCSLTWEELEPPQVKEEHHILCSIHEGEQHVLNEETQPSIVTAAYKSNHIEPELNCDVVFSHSPPGKKSLNCKPCGKSFSCQSSLNRHLRIHTGEKSYSCKICGKYFRKKRELTVHSKTHIGEKPFSCKTCGKCFGRNSNLTLHTRTHTGKKPFSCKICGKCFNQRGDLVVHMRTHTGEKPFSCKTCGKRFTINCNLMVHMRTHTGEKPFLCKICGKPFSNSFNVIRHLKTHTDKKTCLPNR